MVITLVVYVMSIKSYVLVILLERDQSAYGIIILLVHILLYDIIPELYVLYVMHMH